MPKNEAAHLASDLDGRDGNLFAPETHRMTAHSPALRTTNACLCTALNFGAERSRGQ